MSDHVLNSYNLTNRETLDIAMRSFTQIAVKPLRVKAAPELATILIPLFTKICEQEQIQRIITKAVDDVLRNEQAGFRKGRRCADLIFTPRNILEQSSEWNRQLFVNFIDYEKAFDSIHRDSLWQILRAYGIPQHTVNISKCFYSNMLCWLSGSELRN